MVRAERLEMRLDGEMLERLESWMEEAGETSRSEAARQLMSLGLSVATGKSVHLSDGEKLNFMILRDIAKHLKVTTEVDTDFIAKTIHGGHYWAPLWDLQGLFHNHADRPSNVNMVVDVLDMWDFIEERISQLPPDEVERVKGANHGFLPTFSGFDGNNESELMNIAKFLVEDMRRFTRFSGRDLNSHAPSAARYRQMFAVFKSIRATLGSGRRLSAEQIIATLQAER